MSSEQEGYDKGYRVVGIKDSQKGTLAISLPNHPLVRIEVDMFTEEPDEDTADAFEWLVYNLPEVINAISTSEDIQYVDVDDFEEFPNE